MQGMVLFKRWLALFLLAVGAGGAQSQDTGICPLHLLVGLDVTDYQQSSLHQYLEGIIWELSSLTRVSCAQLNVTLSIQSVDQGGEVLFRARLTKYQHEVLQQLREVHAFRRTYLNQPSLHRLLEMNRGLPESNKVVLLFTDGLDDDVRKLEEMSAALRVQGQLDALVTIAMNNATNLEELQLIEFGRRFRHSQQLSMESPEIGSVLAQELLAVSERKCCHPCPCTCIGLPGLRGPLGIPGRKGRKGAKGLVGDHGHYGHSGEQGLRGLPGSWGTQGCPGQCGPKGLMGYPGEQGAPGEAGYDGIPGEKGEAGPFGNPGTRGSRGRQGRKGSQGLRGDAGPPGPPGDAGNPGRSSTERGAPGRKGERGTQGNSGPEGSPGPPGSQGPTADPSTCLKGQKGAQGLSGDVGSPGNTGPAGPQGEKGQAGGRGEKGNAGSLGPKGALGDNGCDKRGSQGRKGPKGSRGGHGDPGAQGERGDKGARGDKGWKGLRGSRGPLGRKGDQGLRGSVGPPGEMGLRGLPGVPLFTPCELIASVRERCDPDSLACPLFPTELALVVETSANVTPAEFGRMKDALAFLLRDLRISQGNCPAGARVALLSYASTPTYLLRFTDMQTKGMLLRLVGDLSYVHSTQRGRLAAAMRFVGRNTFKRVRPALLGRKVAVFLTSGRGQAQEGIGKVVLEYVALGIVPVVVTFSSLPVVEQAFQMDETFRVVQLPAADSSRDVEALREAVFLCTLCFDICKPGNCTKEPLLQNPLGLDLDLVLLVDNSPLALPVGSLGRVAHLFSSILDHLKISPRPELPDSGARVSLVLTGPSRAHLASEEVLWEFPFTQHGSRERIKEHLQLSLAAREAAMPVSQAMEWTLRQAFRESPSHKLRVLFAVVTRETDLWDQETLPELSRFAQCGAFAMFILALGPDGAGKQEGIVPEPLAFPAWRYHFLRLGSVQEPEMEYAERMVLGFLRNLLVESRRHPLERTSAWCELELSPTNPSATPPPPVSPDRVSKPGALPQDGMEAATISPSEVRGVVDSEDPCFLGKDSGVKCTSYSLLWYYRVDMGSCNRFWYGGCGGNANRFNSEQDCIRVCIDRSTHAAGLGEEKNLTQAVCLEDRDAGPCHSFALKWFFNKTQPARCTPFWYGGCEGNRNRFETRELCESTCLPLAGQMLLQQSAGESVQADESRPGCASGADV
ncbi:collagen alpha-3(VI) chain-like isoform X3 [Mauremys reevesii]|uniref:collagen alpha-3(VI) chain-like isoform X3 n=1 Tax=Mauremys reevesii TaxID=260615 RepID=UPI00193EEB8A|nr:collagen alpha-3(VI) chain-like isoform X3 [Mauremys reevesii]